MTLGLIVAAAVLAVVTLVQSRATSLLGWAVLALALAWSYPMWR